MISYADDLLLSQRARARVVQTGWRPALLYFSPLRFSEGTVLGSLSKHDVDGSENVI